MDIAQRPEIVDKKERLGDWEADLVSGRHHKGFLVTLVERLTKYTLIGHVVRKESKLVTAEIIRLLKPFSHLVHTITYDNGREFSGHSEVNKALDSQSYFAAPYHSWDRGLNENTNGLIRQYFPKGTDLRNASLKKIKFVMDSLNNRPRKTLDFATPRDTMLLASTGLAKFQLCCT